MRTVLRGYAPYPIRRGVWLTTGFGSFATITESGGDFGGRTATGFFMPFEGEVLILLIPGRAFLSFSHSPSL